MEFIISIIIEVLNKVLKKIIKYAGRKKLIREATIKKIPLDYIPEAIIRDSCLKKDNLYCSFKIEIALHSRIWLNKKNQKHFHPEWILDDKSIAYKFAELLKLKIPKIYQLDVRLNALKFNQNSLIKPTDGFLSNGVHIIYDDNFIVRHKDQKCLSKKDVIKECKENIQNKIYSDNWISEQLILNKNKKPAYDVKFYCFYGHAPLALVVDRNNANSSYIWLDRDLKATNTGNEKNPKFIDHGLKIEHFELAEMISKKIPTPFIRIDFLIGDDLVFIEFGNLVGNFCDFNETWDRKLGFYFSESRRNLYKDLFNGNNFSEWMFFLKDTELEKCA